MRSLVPGWGMKECFIFCENKIIFIFGKCLWIMALPCMFLRSVVDSSCLCYQFAFLLLVFRHKSIYWQNIEFLSFSSRMLLKTSHLLNLHMEHSFLISLFGCQKLSFIINTSVYKLGVIVFRRIIWNSSSTHTPFCV